MDWGLLIGIVGFMALLGAVSWWVGEKLAPPGAKAKYIPPAVLVFSLLILSTDNLGTLRTWLILQSLALTFLLWFFLETKDPE